MDIEPVSMAHGRVPKDAISGPRWAEGSSESVDAQHLSPSPGSRDSAAPPAPVPQAKNRENGSARQQGCNPGAQCLRPVENFSQGFPRQPANCQTVTMVTPRRGIQVLPKQTERSSGSRTLRCSLSLQLESLAPEWASNL